MPNTSVVSTLLVGVDFGHDHFDGALDELGLLAQSAGLQPVARITCKRKAPDAALFVGTGKADEIKLLAQQTGATEVLFDQALSPAQQRNLERRLEMPVNDRIFLILKIFAQRARSHEGKLQVELANLQYVSTRLVRRWSHLERQSGGIGMRGGPGEKQIELDKRIIGDAIKRTKERLEKVKNNAIHNAANATNVKLSISHWLAIPTQANRLCSILWSKHAPMRLTNCLPHSTQPHGNCI